MIVEEVFFKLNMNNRERNCVEKVINVPSLVFSRQLQFHLLSKVCLMQSSVRLKKKYDANCEVSNIFLNIFMSFSGAKFPSFHKPCDIIIKKIWM